MPHAKPHAKTSKRLSLRAWRDYRALSLSELAALAHVDRQSIHRIEHGQQSPQPRTRRKLAKALHIAVEHIEWGDGG